MLFTEFEAVYEQFLFPGGVVFFVVDNINVPVMYKMFLLSPRAKHRVMRRWWVPNSDQAFIAVSDERKVRAIAGRSIAGASRAASLAVRRMSLTRARLIAAAPCSIRTRTPTRPAELATV